MKTNHHFSHLAQYTVHTINRGTDGIHVSAECNTEPTRCPHCNARTFGKWGSRQQPRQFRDLPLDGMPVLICIEQSRYRCKACKKTFMQPLPHMAEKSFTTRMTERIASMALEQTYADVSRALMVSKNTVAWICEQHIQELDTAQLAKRYHATSWIALSWATRIGTHTGKSKGAQACVVADANQGTLVDIFDLPAERQAETFALHANKFRMSQITRATMPPWPAARAVIAAASPGCTITVDPCAVLQLADNALEQTRDASPKNATAAQRRLMQHQAYMLKQAAYSLYDTQEPDEARTRIDALLQAIPPALQPCFAHLSIVLIDWRDEVLNYFADDVATNETHTELQLLRRALPDMTRGHSFKVARARLLYATGRAGAAPRIKTIVRKLRAGLV